MSADRTWAVYVFRSPGGEALYVGMTGNQRARFAVHKCLSVWWDPGNRVAIEAFPQQRDAAVREARLIDRLKPPHNKVNPIIWQIRREEIEALLASGIPPAEVRGATGIPANTLENIIYRARRTGVLPRVGWPPMDRQ